MGKYAGHESSDRGKRQLR
jgi:hypothetical protein